MTFQWTISTKELKEHENILRLLSSDGGIFKVTCGEWLIFNWWHHCINQEYLEEYLVLTFPTIKSFENALSWTARNRGQNVVTIRCSVKKAAVLIKQALEQLFSDEFCEIFQTSYCMEQRFNVCSVNGRS